MRKRKIVVALIGLAAAGMAAACGGGTDAAAERDGSARAAHADTTQGSAEGPAERKGGADLAVAHFAVGGMTCGGCALATEMAVRKLEGVRSADADYDDATGEGSCTVEYAPETVSTDRIAVAIEAAGFTPRLQGGSPR